VDERLKKLAEDFLKFANSKTISGELTNEAQGEVEAVPGEVEDVLAESSGVIEDAVVEEVQQVQHNSTTEQFSHAVQEDDTPELVQTVSLSSEQREVVERKEIQANPNPRTNS
jgi:uncharacterized protein (DUF1697 family)